MPRSRGSTSSTLVRARVWVEREGGIALTDAGADLLEQIEAKGSLSEAARSLRFSYRHAWKLLDIMNRLWDKPLVVTAVGESKAGARGLPNLGGGCFGAFAIFRFMWKH